MNIINIKRLLIVVLIFAGVIIIPYILGLLNFLLITERSTFFAGVPNVIYDWFCGIFMMLGLSIAIIILVAAGYTIWKISTGIFNYIANK